MREDHGHRRDRGHHTDPDAVHDGSLTDLLDRCGHYFAHRIGASRRGQSNVLAFLAQNPGVTQKELVEALGVIPASLSEVLAKLERKGYVLREKDENDRRFTRVRLTEEGEQALEQPEDVLSEPFQALTPEEQETLRQLLAKLLADWEERCTADRQRQGGRSRREHSGHGDEHPGHGDEHPGHGDEHPGHRRDDGEERGSHRGHGRR
ncbi:MAG: MarR family winged helix-turn-helix transcriptional regulator [Oscillospiraceae bacterium]